MHIVTTRLVKGNEAVVIGALFAGCDSYFGYPITPASEIAQLAATYFPKLGRPFLQAECETASINMVYGAAAAGKRSMTGSSSLGISLMQEGVSYLAGAELPCVIVNVMRAGPGLGNIGPEQADYNQAVKGGGHGNYHNIVLAPGSVQEMCDFTIRAFDLAFKYRNPAFILTDAVLGQMMEPLLLPEKERPATDTTAWAVQGNAATRGNVITSILLDPDVLEAHNRKLQAKYASMAVEASWESYRTDGAELILAGYGICSRIARTAVDACRERGWAVGLFRPQTLFPFPTDALRHLADAPQHPQLLVVELSNGQFHDDIRFQLGTRSNQVGLLNRMGGNLMSVEDVIREAGRRLQKTAAA